MGPVISQAYSRYQPVCRSEHKRLDHFRHIQRERGFSWHTHVDVVARNAPLPHRLDSAGTLRAIH